MQTNRVLGKMYDAAIAMILILLCFAIIYPLYYMLIVSISDGNAVLRGEVNWVPLGPTLNAYKYIFQDPMVITAYSNTLKYTFVGTLICVVMSALCAYPLSRSRFYGRSLFTALVLFTMFFEGGIIPNYILINGLGLINTMWAIVLPSAISVWYMIIMRTFFQQIPNEIHESGYMDGANDMQIFVRIIIPLSVPVFATMTLFYAVWHWNSFFPAMLYLNERALYPMQIIMRNIVVQGDLAGIAAAAVETSAGSINVTGLNLKYAVIYVTITPILAAYPFIQKYFVKGMMVGSLKG